MERNSCSVPMVVSSSAKYTTAVIPDEVRGVRSFFSILESTTGVVKEERRDELFH